MHPTQETPQWHCFFEARARLGEMPVWSAEERALYWVDTRGHTLNRKGVDSALRQWPMPDRITTYAFLPDRLSAIVSLSSGLFRLDLASGQLQPLAAAPYDLQNYSFNDGRCDAAGRFWVGTIRQPQSTEPDGGAGWYRYDERGLSLQVTGTTIANGLAWSPDSRTMYVADRPNWRILAFDYDLAEGTAGNRRTFARVPEGELPDGAAMDAEGGYWIAMHRGGRVLRFRPDGVLDRDIRAPVRHITMVSFGGPDMSTLFLTSSRLLATPDPEPLAGAIFSLDVGVRGIPERRYTRPFPPTPT